MKYTKTSLLYILFLLLQSCASISYVEPKSGPTASVRFASEESGVLIIRGYDNAQCQGEKEWMRLRKGVLLRSNPKSLDIPLNTYHKNAFKEFKVRSDESLNFMFFYSEQSAYQTSSCAVPVNIDLSENKMYELKFKNCAVFYREIFETSPKNFEYREFKTYPPFGTQECINAFKKARLY